MDRLGCGRYTMRVLNPIKLCCPIITTPIRSTLDEGAGLP